MKKAELQTAYDKKCIECSTLNNSLFTARRERDEIRNEVKSINQSNISLEKQISHLKGEICGLRNPVDTRIVDPIDPAVGRGVYGVNPMGTWNT